MAFSFCWIGIEKSCLSPGVQQSNFLCIDVDSGITRGDLAQNVKVKICHLSVHPQPCVHFVNPACPRKFSILSTVSARRLVHPWMDVESISYNNQHSLL